MKNNSKTAEIVKKIFIFIIIASLAGALITVSIYLSEANREGLKIISTNTENANKELSVSTENLASIEKQLKAYEGKMDKIIQEINFGKYEEYIATAYSLNDPSQGTTSTNALGWDLNDERFMQIPQIAVDPAVLSLNILVEIIDFEDDSITGVYWTSDTGGKVKGNHIDILVNGKQKAKDIGTRKIYLRVLDKGINLKN